MKRGYFVYGDDDAAGFAVVAATAKEAKKIAVASGELDADWIDIRCLWQRDADVADLPIGMVTDARVGLRCGIYGYLDEYPCDVCGKDADVRAHNGMVLCGECLEKEYAKAAD